MTKILIENIQIKIFFIRFTMSVFFQDKSKLDLFIILQKKIASIA